MELIQVSLTSIGSVIALFILTKLIGNREMSQLSMFDYIIGITIGSIAAEMATALEDDFLKPLLAMAIYALAAILMSVINYKSIKLRRLLMGKPLILYQNGKLYKKNLKKSKMDISEFLTQCRNNGYFDISKLQLALLETNGKISFLPLSTTRPSTPEDFNITPQIEKPLANVIIDGNIQFENLKNVGKNEEWLKSEMKKQGYSKASDIFLATCDINNTLKIYTQIDEANTTDIFE